MSTALEVRLNLRSDLTLGDLRAFLSLAEEAPNDSPLLYDHDDDGLLGVVAISTFIS